MSHIPYTSQTINSEDIKAVEEVLQSNWITRGPKVQELEKAIQEYCNAPYVVLFNSGTTALDAAIYTADVNSKDTIYSSPNTFVGTLAGALKRTSNLQFLDIDPETKSPNFQGIPKQSNGSRAILLPVHYAGMAKQIEKPGPNDFIIEDACQAFGARYLNGEKVGSCPSSDLTVFSFHPAKTICMGEGGAVTTRSEILYKRLLLYRNNGIVKNTDDLPWMYHIEDLTSNFNVTEFQAALGLSQLRRIDEFLTQRKALVTRYRSHLESCSYLSLSPKTYDEYSSHNLFPVEIDFEGLETSREDVMNSLFDLGISTQVHFIPLYRQPYFQKHFSFSPMSFPHQEHYYQRALSLPLYSHLTLQQVDYICESLQAVLLQKSPKMASKLDFHL